MAKGREGSALQNPTPTPVNFTSSDITLMSRLQGPTYSNMEPLPREDNPDEQVAQQGYGINGKFDDFPDTEDDGGIYTGMYYLCAVGYSENAMLVLFRFIRNLISNLKDACC